MARKASLARGTMLGVTAQVWHLLTAFVLFHFLSKELGPAGFGKWRVALSVLLYFEMVVDTGIVQVATKRLAEAPDDAPRLERAAYLGQAVLAGVLFVAAMVLAGPIASALNDPSLEFLLRIAALDIPLVAAFMIAGAILLGHHRFGRQAFGMSVYATAKFLAIGFLVWKGFSVPGALIGNAIASVVGFAVMFQFWPRARVKLQETVAEARGMGVAAVPFVGQTLIAGVEYESALWFVQAFAGSVSSGLFGAAAALAEIPTFLFAGLSRALFPSVARADAEKDEALISVYMTQSLRLALLVTVLGIAVIAATGEALLTFIYTAAFAGAAVPFAILMVASCGRNVRATCTDVMMARGRRKAVLTLLAASTVLEVVLLFIAVPRYGLVGAASAAAIAAVIAGIVGVYAVRQLVRPRVGLTLLRSIVAAAIVGAGLAMLAPSGVWLIPAYVAAALVYAALLIALQELDRADLDSIRAATRS